MSDRHAATAPTARNWILGAVLVVVTLGLRLPTWTDQMLFIDEPYYHVIALRLLVPGTVIYPPPILGEPPLGPLSFLATVTYWLAILISPSHAITVVHGFTTLAIVSTTLLLLAGGVVFLGTPWPGFLGGLLYALMGSSGSEPDMFFIFSGLEHFQAPFLLAFVLGFLRSVQRRRLGWAIGAGAALGIAALYKMNVVLLLALPWVVAVSSSRQGLPVPRALVLAGATTLSALLLIATVPLYYAAVGLFGSWYFYNVEMLRTYSTIGGAWTEKAGMLAKTIRLKALLLGGLVYGALLVPRIDRSAWAATLGMALSVAWLLLFLSLSPGHYKPHYLIQALPMQCLLTGMLVVGAWRFIAATRAQIRPYMSALYAVAVVLPLAYGVYGLVQGWFVGAAYAARGAHLDLHRRHGTLEPLLLYVEAHTDPRDLIYVHSEAPELYFLTQRLPAVNDPVGSWIAHMPSNKVADSLLMQLQASPPRLIIQLDYRRYGREEETLQKWPQLATWLAAHYRERTQIEHTHIWERQGVGGDAPTPVR